MEGVADGPSEGTKEGMFVGFSDGAIVGFPGVTVGLDVGVDDGT
jgi:hypothetical protein